MVLFETKSEKKSLILTTVISVGLVLLLFFFGLTSMYPPEVNGIAVNFGTSTVGSGAVQPTEPLKSTPATATPQQTPPEQTAPPVQNTEEVITQNTEPAPVINEKEEKQNNKTQNRTQPKTTPPQKTTKTPVKEPEPQPSKSTTEALNNILNANENGTGTQGEGNDNQAGDKGSPYGDTQADSYYGRGQGSMGQGNYRLSGREALVKTKYVQNCNEEGTVVVEIKVNRQGKVVRAIPGVKGTTNTSACLLNPAKRAALDTRFSSDPNAPSIQTGYIVYVFKLSD